VQDCPGQERPKRLADWRECSSACSPESILLGNVCDSGRWALNSSENNDPIFKNLKSKHSNLHCQLLSAAFSNFIATQATARTRAT
jgi:hypothetical protein